MVTSQKLFIHMAPCGASPQSLNISYPTLLKVVSYYNMANDLFAYDVAQAASDA